MSIYRGIDGERLYTAAEMKAAFRRGFRQAVDLARGGIYLRCDIIGIGEKGMLRLPDVVGLLDELDRKGEEINGG